MSLLHIHRPQPIGTVKLWCPFCDEVGLFKRFEWYEDVICPKCGRWFPHQNQWPRGFDITTGEIKG